MSGKLKLLLINSDPLTGEIKELVIDSGWDADFYIFPDYRSFLKTNDNLPDIIIVPFEDRARAKKLLNAVALKTPGIPVILIMSRPDHAVSIILDLTRAGAAGFIYRDRLSSLNQYLARIEADREPGGVSRMSINASLLNYIVDSQESMISVINEDFKYESVNEAFCRTLKCRREDMIGRSPSDLWGDHTFREVIQENLQRCLKGEVVRYKAFFDKNGVSGKCYEVIYRPYKPAKGIRSYSIVETRDITEIENVRQIAEKTDLRSYYFEKYLPFGVFECDARGKILFSNDTFFNILDIDEKSRSEILIDEFFPTDSRFTEYLKDVKAGESSTFSQLQMITSSGTEIFGRISSHARSDEEHGLVINAILEDTTREVLLEKQLSSTHRMETLGTLAGGIAHDFNTILTTISGYAELTLEEVEPGSLVSDYMSKVSLAIKRAESVINQMLTFSRQIDLEKIPVKISDVIREAADFMKSAIPSTISISSEISDPGMVVMADPTQLFRVFLNIMTNSVQAMENSGGVITIKLLPFTRNNIDFVDVIINDTGTGIDKAIIDRIYEPFFTTKEVGKGTGMGLSVAHGIVTGLGGELNVESVPGTGTTFTVRLPLSDPLAKSRNENGGHSPWTILYADENRFFSRTVSLSLEKLGYRVLLASNLDEVALSLKTQHPQIDIFFIRCGNDIEKGKRLIKNIFDVKNGARIVFITKPGSSNCQDLVNEREKGIGIINEPVSLREIINAINEYI